MPGRSTPTPQYLKEASTVHRPITSKQGWGLLERAKSAFIKQLSIFAPSKPASEVIEAFFFLFFKVDPNPFFLEAQNSSCHLLFQCPALIWAPSTFSTSCSWRWIFFFFLCVDVCRGRLKHLLKKLIFSSLVKKKKRWHTREVNWRTKLQSPSEATRGSRRNLGGWRFNLGILEFWGSVVSTNQNYHFNELWLHFLGFVIHISKWKTKKTERLYSKSSLHNHFVQIISNKKPNISWLATSGPNLFPPLSDQTDKKTVSKWEIKSCLGGWVGETWFHSTSLLGPWTHGEPPASASWVKS